MDCLANKGWIQATIINDGFHIRLFNLHTQAEYYPSAVTARAWQILLLSVQILVYRANHPDHVVFAVGDYNVYGETPEYNETLLPLVGGFAGGRDADRNSPGFQFDESQWTYSDTNPLVNHFDGGSGRLDYIFYFPSLDGSVEVLPISVSVLPFRGPVVHTEDDMTKNESSDLECLRAIQIDS